jgi:hypothetical protein
MASIPKLRQLCVNEIMSLKLHLHAYKFVSSFILNVRKTIIYPLKCISTVCIFIPSGLKELLEYGVLFSDVKIFVMYWFWTESSAARKRLNIAFAHRPYDLEIYRKLCFKYIRN